MPFVEEARHYRRCSVGGGRNTAPLARSAGRGGEYIESKSEQGFIMVWHGVWLESMYVWAIADRRLLACMIAWHVQ